MSGPSPPCGHAVPPARNYKLVRTAAVTSMVCICMRARERADATGAGARMYSFVFTVQRLDCLYSTSTLIFMRYGHNRISESDMPQRTSTFSVFSTCIQYLLTVVDNRVCNSSYKLEEEVHYTPLRVSSPCSGSAYLDLVRLRRPSRFRFHTFAVYPLKHTCTSTYV
jgi:hypothetical protein